MVNKVPEDLRLLVNNNKIVNTDDLLITISKENNYEMLNEYYNFLNNNVNKNEYEDIDVILFAMKSRVNALEVDYKLKEELENAKKINPELEKFTLMEDFKEINDIGKDMHYLKYVNDDGTLTILEITNNKLLLNLIATIAPTMTAENFIKLLKTKYFNELPTYGMGKHEISILEYEHTSLIADKNNYNIEKQILSRDYPTIVPKVSIDSNKGRLYHIGQTVIKFHDEDGKRMKTILSNENKELENKTIENNEINYAEQEGNLYNSENDFTINRNDLDNIEVNIDEAINLIRLYEMGQNLEKSEMSKIYSFLLEVLAKYELEQELTETEQYLLGISIDKINQKDMARNNIEQEILNRYTARTQTLEKENGKDSLEKPKVKTYTQNNNPLAIDDGGASLTIIIITVTILLGAILAAVLLVK